MKKGKLTFIGLGLFDENDISLKGLEEIKKCDKVYGEFYTSNLFGTSIKKIEEKIGKSIKILSRSHTESGDIILKTATSENVAFLTGGDSMTATTHIDLRIRAIEMGIQTNIIHCSSIITAVPGLLGLQIYKFGRKTTIAYPEKKYFPTSPYEVIKENKKIGLHTLVLLDIQAENDRYMTANEGIAYLLEIERKIENNIIDEDSILCVVARAGSSDPVVKADRIDHLRKIDFGPPLHTIVVPGKLHFMEIDALEKLAGLSKTNAEKLQKI